MSKQIPVPLHTPANLADRDMIDMLISTGAISVKRYPEMRRMRETSTVGRKGGAVPSYLNPLLMGERESA